MSVNAKSVSQLLAEADASGRPGHGLAARTWPTSFTPLDDHLGGGMRAGELLLVGGPQGQGKTTFVLQLARAVAAAGSPALYVSYEHPAADVLVRLLAMEAGLTAGDDAAFRLTELRAALGDGAGRPGFEERVVELPGGAEALAGLRAVGQHLHVVGASGRPARLEDVRASVLESDERPVLFVDYLQKVATGTPHLHESEEVTTVVESLKDLALEAAVPVVAVVAADSTGIATGRVRLHHLRGSSALAYEADVALMINNKYDSVAREHLAFSTTNVERFRGMVVCSIEKNRSGRDRVDLEFHARFDRGCLDPLGGLVVERLVDDRLAGG